MVQRELSASSFLFSIVCILLLVSCTRKENLKYINLAEHDFKTKGGNTYLDGVLFTGAGYELYKTGDTAYCYSYKNGKQDGRSVEYYTNKQVKEERWYKDNRKEGIHRGWFENGKPKFVAGYKNDAYDGNVKEWIETGQMFRDFNYKNGQEEGMQRMYWENGTIRANYQSLNGRKYGLTGVKNCVSIWDSISTH